MVATEAAGEGINLQFCHLMVNYDIPWNPNRLEQRMGASTELVRPKTFTYSTLLHRTLARATSSQHCCTRWRTWAKLSGSRVRRHW